MLAGELATGQTLWGDLPRPVYPEALRRSAPPFSLDRADRGLDYTHLLGSLVKPDQLRRGGWQRYFSKARTLGWLTEASEHSTRSEWSNGQI